MKTWGKNCKKKTFLAATNLRDSVDERYWGGNGNLAEGEGRLAESVSAPPAHLHKPIFFYYTMKMNLGPGK